MPSTLVPAPRNAPCPCGSGLKAKRCCARGKDRGKRERARSATPEPEGRRASDAPAAEHAAPAARAAAPRAAPRPRRARAGLLAATFALAGCSIVYELMLGQALSAFLGNTVLRYSVPIGLYMLAMGIGAMLARGRVLTRPLLNLQRVELALTVLGGSSVMLLFLTDALDPPRLALATLAHGLILAIGVLSGLEIPLLIALDGAGARSTTRVLGVDYLGAFCGTLVFAFFCYPRLGLLPTAFAVAAVNALVGLLVTRGDGAQQAPDPRLVTLQALLLSALLVALGLSGSLTEFGRTLYLS